MPSNNVSFCPDPMRMACDLAAYLWPSCPVTSAPTSHSAAPYLS